MKGKLTLISSFHRDINLNTPLTFNIVTDS